MTSLSVRQYVLGIYAKLGLREQNVTKVQTGGPDGDLGSSAYTSLLLSCGLSSSAHEIFFCLVIPFRFSIYLYYEMCLQKDEILLSNDRTIAIIDGSGVLADPAGLNREELRRLARARVPVANFDTTKLGKEGYLVRVEDQDIKLPCKCLFFVFRWERLLGYLLVY